LNKPLLKHYRSKNVIKSQKRPEIKEMTDYSEKNIKELGVHYKGYRRYKTILSIAKKPTAHREIKELVIDLGNKLLDKGIP